MSWILQNSSHAGSLGFELRFIFCPSKLRNTAQLTFAVELEVTVRLWSVILLYRSSSGTRCPVVEVVESLFLEVFKRFVDVAEEHDLVMGLSRSRRWLDWMILKIFSNLYDSAICPVYNLKPGPARAVPPSRRTKHSLPVVWPFSTDLWRCTL